MTTQRQTNAGIPVCAIRSLCPFSFGSPATLRFPSTTLAIRFSPSHAISRRVKLRFHRRSGRTDSSSLLMRMHSTFTVAEDNAEHCFLAVSSHLGFPCCPATTARAQRMVDVSHCSHQPSADSPAVARPSASDAEDTRGRKSASIFFASEQIDFRPDRKLSGADTPKT